MVAFVLVGAAIAMLSDLNQFAALLLVSGADYLNVFTTVQLQGLALLFLKLNSVGSSIAFVFWGLWLVPLGYLVFRSSFLPRILGALLVIAGFGYFLDSFGTFLGYHPGIAAFAALGEMLFTLWLLIKGLYAEQWAKRALESA